MLVSLIDLIVLSALLSVNPAVKEAVAAYTRGDRKGKFLSPHVNREVVGSIPALASLSFCLTQNYLKLPN